MAAYDGGLALVGKTMTYDSGGYSLKISNSMKGMKYDMNGGAAVFGAMIAISRLKLPVHVFGVGSCVCETAKSGSSDCMLIRLVLVGTNALWSSERLIPSLGE